jgi:hypothetical protein
VQGTSNDWEEREMAGRKREAVVGGILVGLMAVGVVFF